MENRFTSILSNEHLIENGFVDGIQMPTELVSDFRNHYASLTKPNLTGFHPTLMWKDAGQKQVISQYICQKLEPYVQQLFPNHRVLYGNYMVKEPGEESKMKLHQDWSYIDEAKGDSFAIWFPLQELTTQNGALHMIPKSDRFKNEVRGPGVFCPFYDEHVFIEKEYGQALYLKSGEAVVWKHPVLHYSSANLSNYTRIAVTAIIVPKDTPILHYFKPEDSEETEIYAVDDDFFFHYAIGKRPLTKAKLIGKVDYRIEAFSQNALQQMLGSDKRHKDSWWKKLFLSK